MKRTLPLILLVLMIVALSCAPAGPQAGPRTRAPEHPAYSRLRAGIMAFERGEMAAALAEFDRLLAAATASDSQLVFLGAYYGMRARLDLGMKDAADSLYDRLSQRIPSRQRRELELVLGRVQAPSAAPGQAVLPASLTADRIGVILPLSGKFSEFGEAILQGIRVAVDQHNMSAGGEELVLDVRDDASDPIRSASLGRTLASDSSVAALIGSYEDETSLSLALAASSAGVPLVCPTASAPGLDNLGPMVHVLNRTDPALAADLARFAVDSLGLRMFAVMARDDTRGNRLASSFAEGVGSAGGAVVFNHRYSPDATNYELEFSLLQRYYPDALYMPVPVEDITQLASQVYYYGLYGMQLLGSEEFDNPRVIRLGGEYVDGAVFSSSFYSENPGLRWEEFKQAYEEQYRRPVNRFSALGYDAALMIIQAAGDFPASRGRLASAINSLDSMSGAMGIYSVRANGMVGRRTFILQLADGHVVPATAPRPESEAPTDSLGTGAR